MKKKYLFLALLFSLSACSISNEQTPQPGKDDGQVTPSDGGNTDPTPQPIVYTITFASNGGSGSMNSEEVNEGSDFTLPLNEFTAPEGQEFVGWRVNGEGDILVPGAKIKVNGNIILVAQWKDIPNESADPADPEDPTDPEDPADPGDPTDPTDPEDPTNPEDPADPGDPTDPTDPQEPEEEVISEISIRNLYFSDYAGGDTYLSELEKKFDLKFNISSYDYVDWDSQVNLCVNGGNLTDVFHANITSDNYGTTYAHWAEEEIIKPLPEDLTKWPNIKNLIEHTSNVDFLKIDGKLYGIPIAKNTTDYSTNLSSYTHVYRRDWAKKWGVYQENDIYTWEQFQTLLQTFKLNLNNYSYALGDVEWGFPSVANFYKTAPGCFAQDAEGSYVNNYTTDEYIQGIETTKSFVSNGLYYLDQYSSYDGRVNDKYCANSIGVFYENLSYSNYSNMRRKLKMANAGNSSFDIDDASAIMKVKGPDGKYVLEGTENWFSMSLFDANISDKKQEKILDIFDWLLSEEGTRFAVYGMEDHDYVMVDDKPQLIEESWDKDTNGNYVSKMNGAKYLRYAVSLGNDLNEYDPIANHEVYSLLNDWETEMKVAFNNNQLKVIAENPEVAWLATPMKSNYSLSMRNDGSTLTMKYVYNKIKTLDEYRASFNTTSWTNVLKEINDALGK